MLDVAQYLAEGKTAEIRKMVTVEDTVGNSSPYLTQLLSTSACVELMVRATMEAVEGDLPEGYITVGKSLWITHSVPTLMGTAITVRATLSEISGNRLIVDVVGNDSLGEIFTGRTERVVVNRLGLIDRATERAMELKELRERQ
jgi:predicted thioesterase